MTPEEAWSRSKPSVNHFRVFGCISHVHIPDISKKIIISRDVKFEEENSWDWDKSHEETIIANLDWGESDNEAIAVNTNRGDTEADHHTTEIMEGNDSDESNEENSVNPSERRIRRPPTWMRDYESGEGLSEEEDTTYQALFAGSDPVSYRDAVKVWLRRILEGLNHVQHDSTTVYCDNSSAIKLSKNLVMHGRCKHIDVRFHFLRDLTKDGVVKMVHCPTQEQVADIMTKPLKLDAFLKMRDLLGVCLDPEVN
ncbi:hypothetical protein MRB53_029570 [Persea americana]|uniref:Uncharacterized protein n=1 Tax=Persea americana TaxID=3435 RepID=A0ACC2KIS7_PERAE|nr:hypothetical protein MRB53_029570 [Persea americana]